MSLGTVSKQVEVTICDFCDKEITYYSETHARLNIQKVNDNPSNRFDVTDKVKHVFWWRKKHTVFGNDQYDFHGDCIVELMSKLTILKKQ